MPCTQIVARGGNIKTIVYALGVRVAGSEDAFLAEELADRSRRYERFMIFCCASKPAKNQTELSELLIFLG